VTDERRVDRPPGEPLAQLRPVDAGEIGLEAEPDEGSDELGRVPMPDREDALHADPRQVPLAIGAEILQEDVPEGDRPDARLAVFAHRAFHQRCVFLVGAAVRRQVELVERHPDRRGLLLEKLDPHAVVADAVELAGHRRQERHDLIPRAPAKFVERHRAVLTSTPREDHFFSVGHRARSRHRETPSLTLHLPALRLVDAHRRRRGAGETGVAALASGGVEDERRLPRQVRRVDDVAPALPGDLELDQPRRLRRGREGHREGATVVLEGAVLRFPAGLRGAVERAARDGQVDDLADDHARAGRHRIHGRGGATRPLAREKPTPVARSLTPPSGATAITLLLPKGPMLLTNTFPAPSVAVAKPPARPLTSVPRGVPSSSDSRTFPVVEKSGLRTASTMRS